MWYYFLVIYLQELGIAITVIGVLLTIVSFIGMFFSIMGGVLADSIGRKKTLISLLPLAALATLLLASANIILIYLAMILFSFSVHGVRAAARVFVSEKLPKTSLGKGLGIYYTIVSAATALAPTVGGLIVNSFGYKSLFIIASILAIVPPLILIKTKETLEYSKPVNIKSYFNELKKKTVLALTSNRLLLFYYLLFCLYLFATEITVPFIPLYCKKILRFNELEVGFMYTIVSIITTPSHGIGGFLADKVGYAKTLVLILALNITIFPILPLVNEKYLFTALWALSCFIFTAHEAPETSLVVTIASPELRATATATATMLQGLTSSLGPLVGGYIWATLSPKSSFLVTAVIAAMAVVLFGLPLLRYLLCSKQNK